MEVIIFKSYAIIGLVIFLIYPYIDKKFELTERYGYSKNPYFDRLFTSAFYPLTLYIVIFWIFYEKFDEEIVIKSFRFIARSAELALAIYLIYRIIS